MIGGYSITNAQEIPQMISGILQEHKNTLRLIVDLVENQIVVEDDSKPTVGDEQYALSFASLAPYVQVSLHESIAGQDLISTLYQLDTKFRQNAGEQLVCVLTGDTKELFAYLCLPVSTHLFGIEIAETTMESSRVICVFSRSRNNPLMTIARTVVVPIQITEQTHVEPPTRDHTPELMPVL